MKKAASKRRRFLMKFEFHNPTHLIFGVGKLSQFGPNGLKKSVMNNTAVVVYERDENGQ